MKRYPPAITIGYRPRKPRLDWRLRAALIALAISVGILSILFLTGCAHAPEWDRVTALRAKGVFTGRVSSSVSMHGYKAGDILKITVQDLSQVKAGDPVYFWDYTHDRPTFHVAISKTTQGWVTKGTANAHADSQLLTERTYIGRWEVVK